MHTTVAVYLLIDFNFLVSWLKYWQHFNRLHIWTWHLLLKSKQSLVVRYMTLSVSATVGNFFPSAYIHSRFHFFSKKIWKVPNSESILNLRNLLTRGIYICENNKFWKAEPKQHNDWSFRREKAIFTSTAKVFFCTP